MKRRDVLSRAATLVAAGSVAGCVGSGRSPVGGDPESSNADSRPSLVDQQFDAEAPECGSTDDGEVAFDEDAGTVTVTGTVTGSDLGTTAELSTAAYNSDADELRVTVAAVDDESDEMAGQCISEIPYEATVSFDGGLPGGVTVVHDGVGGESTVATASR